jgi:hypothetical protein
MDELPPAATALYALTLTKPDKPSSPMRVTIAFAKNIDANL